MRAAALTTLQALLERSSAGAALPGTLTADVSRRLAALVATERNGAIAAQVGRESVLCCFITVALRHVFRVESGSTA